MSFLIALFSVAVPFAKATLILLVQFKKDMANRSLISKLIKSIGKWSMADVFVVAIFIVLQSAKTNESFIVEVHSGFYIFTAYCLVSLAGIQLMNLEPGKL